MCYYQYMVIGNVTEGNVDDPKINSLKKERYD